MFEKGLVIGVKAQIGSNSNILEIKKITLHAQTRNINPVF